MTSKKLKLADIAELAGVSKSTVSFVLNGHAKKHRINEETVRKVEAVAIEHNYTPSIYARALKSKKTYSAGLVVPDLANMGFAQIAKHLESLCRQAGYQLLIVSSEDDIGMEKQAVQSLIDRQVDVLFVASAMTDAQFYSDLNKTTRVILFDRVLETDELITIKTDALSATSEVVSALAQGQSECFYIGGQLTLSPSRERFEGFKQGIEKAGIEFQSRYIYTKDYQPESGYQMMDKLVQDLGRFPRAIFTASYSLLEGVLKYLNDHNALSTKIRIATFDNYAILDCLPLKIDSVEQDCQSIAQTMFEAGKSVVDNVTFPDKHRQVDAIVRVRR